MSSMLQSSFGGIQQNSYTTLIVLTALAYDHVLTFSTEIEYIWNKPWTWVSFLFVIIRYVGLYGFMILSTVLDSTLFKLPGVKMYLFAQPLLVQSIITNFYETVIAYLIETCAFVLFRGAASLVMILRIWAMYDRSRLIMGVLLVFFSMEILSTVLVAIYTTVPTQVFAMQILNLSLYAVPLRASLIWFEVVITLRIVHGVAMCILVIVQFVRQSLQMYTATEQWRLNRYMHLLIKQGILHFFAMLLTMRAWQWTLIHILESVPMLIVMPRFIVSIRELYARDVQGRRGSGIDTGFGLSIGGSSITTAIAFAEVEQNEGVEDIPAEGETVQPM